MRVPYSLLKQCLAKEISPQDIEKALIQVGIEVDATLEYSLDCTDLVVGRVLETTPHPNADRLKCARVDIGSDKILDLVCGAANCREGLLVVCAQVGSRLGSGDKALHIKKSAIRGIESHGMLCSSKELGLGVDHEGIIELDESFKVGENFCSRLTDTIFELSLTPNLGYCLSVEGIAKEISRATGIQFIPWHVQKTPHSKKHLYTISLPNKKLSPRYGYSVIEHIDGARQSPLEQRLLLERCGFFSITAAVDAANLVMLLLGHPLHCFDKDTLPGLEIEVRESRAHEKLTLLDKREIDLPERALLISSCGVPLALAGIMGGLSTAITSSTKAVFVESAYFDPKAVRRTRKKCDTNTEASRRFERGVDPNGIERALNCYYQLLRKDFAGCSLVEQGVIGEPFPEREIVVRSSTVRSLLGLDVSFEEIEQALLRSGLSSVAQETETFLVRIPTSRHDLLEEADLVEEIIKTIGYDRLTIDPQPSLYTQSSMPDHALYVCETWARQLCTKIGLQEWVTCDLIGQDDIQGLLKDLIPQQDIIHVSNPLTSEQSIVRPSLFPGMFASFLHNIAHQERDIQAFEIGKVHIKHGGKYGERLALGILVSGYEHPLFFTDERKQVDFFDLKGILEVVSQTLHLETSMEVQKSSYGLFHPGRQASVYLGQHQVGVMGELHPMLLKKHGIDQTLFFMELDLQELFRVADRRQKQAIPLNVYPAIERDWTVTVPISLSYKELMGVISSHLSKDVEEVTLLSVFSNEKLGDAKKNVTLRFRFRDREKTLVQEDVDRNFTVMTQEVFHSLGLENNRDPSA